MGTALSVLWEQQPFLAVGIGVFVLLSTPMGLIALRHLGPRPTWALIRPFVGAALLGLSIDQLPEIPRLVLLTFTLPVLMVLTIAMLWSLNPNVPITPEVLERQHRLNTALDLILGVWAFFMQLFWIRRLFVLFTHSSFTPAALRRMMSDPFAFLNGVF